MSSDKNLVICSVKLSMFELTGHVPSFDSRPMNSVISLDFGDASLVSGSVVVISSVFPPAAFIVASSFCCVCFCSVPFPISLLFLSSLCRTNASNLTCKCAANQYFGFNVLSNISFPGLPNSLSSISCLKYGFFRSNCGKSP